MGYYKNVVVLKKACVLKKKIEEGGKAPMDPLPVVSL